MAGKKPCPCQPDVRNRSVGIERNQAVYLHAMSTRRKHGFLLHWCWHGKCAGHGSSSATSLGIGQWKSHAHTAANDVYSRAVDANRKLFSLFFSAWEHTGYRIASTRGSFGPSQWLAAAADPSQRPSDGASRPELHSGSGTHMQAGRSFTASQARPFAGVLHCSFNTSSLPSATIWASDCPHIAHHEVCPACPPLLPPQGPC